MKEEYGEIKSRAHERLQGYVSVVVGLHARKYRALPTVLGIDLEAECGVAVGSHSGGSGVSTGEGGAPKPESSSARTVGMSRDTTPSPAHSL